MTAKLTQTTDISEKRDFGATTVNQSLEINVSYDTEDQSIEVDSVFICQGFIKIEVSKLLHKADGNPLNTILEAIDWPEIYQAGKILPLAKPFNIVDFVNSLGQIPFPNPIKEAS